MKILTDSELRARWFRERNKEIILDPGTRLTPAAKDFVKEQGITVREAVTGGAAPFVSEGSHKAMPMAKIPLDANRKPVYVDEASGKVMSDKPESMTHLHGNVLVPKTHPQIAFRGSLDSLEAKIISIQILARADGLSKMAKALGEILDYVKKILGAEVMERPLDEIRLFGLSGLELKYESHHVPEIYGIPHPSPDADMGRMCAELNELRTMVRESELAAAKAFYVDGICTRDDVIEGLNRLSSAVYLLFLRQLTGIWPEYRSPETLPKIPVEASGRHVHLTKEAILELFGEELHEAKPLSQPGQYACKERVTLITPKGEIEHVVVLGPARGDIQVEISTTDARILGINAPIRMSGDLKGAADVVIKGPKGVVNAMGSTIVAKAHIHMTPEDARKYHVTDGERVSVYLDTARPVTIDEVIVRVSEQFSLAMHMDYDEANACAFTNGTLGTILK